MEYAVEFVRTDEGDRLLAGDARGATRRGPEDLRLEDVFPRLPEADPEERRVFARLPEADRVFARLPDSDDEAVRGISTHPEENRG